MKRPSRILALAVACLSAIAAFAAPTPRYLVTDGGSAPLAQRAVAELQLFWKQIFGNELEMVAGGVNAPAPQFI